jgi:hypothetical protein
MKNYAVIFLHWWVSCLREALEIRLFVRLCVLSGGVSAGDFENTCVCMKIRVYVCLCMCMYVLHRPLGGLKTFKSNICICTSMCMCICYTYAYMFVYTCMYTMCYNNNMRIHTYTYVRIHTYTYIEHKPIRSPTARRGRHNTAP